MKLISQEIVLGKKTIKLSKLVFTKTTYCVWKISNCLSFNDGTKGMDVRDAPLVPYVFLLMQSLAKIG